MDDIVCAVCKDILDTNQDHWSIPCRYVEELEDEDDAADGGYPEEPSTNFYYLCQACANHACGGDLLAYLQKEKLNYPPTTYLQQTAEACDFCNRFVWQFLIRLHARHPLLDRETFPFCFCKNCLLKIIGKAFLRNWLKPQ